MTIEEHGTIVKVAKIPALSYRRPTKVAYSALFARVLGLPRGEALKIPVNAFEGLKSPATCLRAMAARLGLALSITQRGNDVFLSRRPEDDSEAHA